MTKGLPPAEGERIAASGYNPQYRVAAAIILKHLRERTLLWIRVADPEAGRVDDFQIGTPSRVDAYQVKWSQHPAYFNYSDLTTGSGGRPNLIAQLADGWQRLQHLHNSSRIVVHLVTNDIASINTKDDLPFGNPPPKPKHFSAFIEQAWRPRKAGGASHSSSWDATWQSLRVAATLTQEQFDLFVTDCELELNFHLPESDASGRPDGQTDDLGQLAKFLFDTVASAERIVEISHVELLRRLNWTHREELRNPHEFPLAETPYEPIDETVTDLGQKLSDLPGGYVLVHGSPGSGKSTLLTQFLLSRSTDRVLRYYAYVPDSQQPISLRGKSENFLHDLVLTLERAGIGRPGAASGVHRRDELLMRLHSQLVDLGEDWRKTGRKTLILVDGLDHIEREQKTERSLLNDLPAPNQVPDGVYFILGSQTDNLVGISAEVKNAISKKERRVLMERLDRGSVFRIVDRADLAEHSEEQREQIFVLSAGHPLALAYLLNRLSTVTDPEQFQSILDSEKVFEGDINDLYFSHWEQIKDDEVIVELLGQVCRLRRVIDLKWVKTWADSRTVERLYSRLGHYFRQEEDYRWYFFHNSFRLFVREKTAESLGSFDISIDRKIHKALATVCGSEPEDSPWAWEVLYHLLNAGDHPGVLGRATQQWFRQQFIALRPADAIQTDIQLAMESAAFLQDAVAMARLSLVAADIGGREFYIEDQSLVSLLLSLGLTDIAVEYVRDGNRLRIKEKDALDISADLHYLGFDEEARRIFELAEPLSILRSTSDVQYYQLKDTRDLLDSWAEVAVTFRDVDSVIENARRLRRDVEPYERLDADTASRNMQNGVLFSAGRSLVSEHRWDDLQRILDQFDTTLESDSMWWFWLHIHAWRECSLINDAPRAQGFCRDAWKLADTMDLDTHALVALAEGIYRVLGDVEAAALIIRDLRQPDVYDGLNGYDGGFHPFNCRFRLNRLLAAFGHEPDLTQTVPDADKPENQGLVYFERAVCIVARIWGRSWRNTETDTASVIREAKSVIQVFYRSNRNREWANWYVARRAQPDLLEMLVRAVAQYGPEAVEQLRQVFDGEWANSNVSQFWPSDVARRVIVQLYEHGANKSWAEERLISLEKWMLEERDQQGRVDECLKQARAWLALEDRDRSRELIKKLLQTSSGIGHRKDYQMNTWIKWLGQIDRVEPERATERLEWFARASVSLGGTTEGPAQREAAKALLRTTFDRSPRDSVSLFHWLIGQESVRHEDGLESILDAAIEGHEAPLILILALLCDILLPISVSSHSKLAGKIIRQKAIRGGNDEAVEAARAILNAVAVHALPSTRSDWRRVIATELYDMGLDLEAAGSTTKDMEPEKESSSYSDDLELKDGSKLSEREVRHRLSSVAALRELLEGATDKSFFKWRTLLPEFARKLTRKEIDELNSVLHDDIRSSFVLGAMAERLAELGHRSAAWQLGEEALRLSARYGWSPWHDGGSRVAAFKGLIAADASMAWTLMFDTLADDGGGGAQNLDIILPLLTDVVPMPEIWKEIEEYVHSLFEHIELPSPGPSLATADRGGNSAAQAIADLIASHAHHWTNALSYAGKGSCVQLLVRREPAIETSIRHLLDGPEYKQECALIIMEAALRIEPDALMAFADQVASLRTTSDYALRRSCDAICGHIPCEPLPTPTLVPKLPVVYDLDIVSNAQFRAPDFAESGKPLPVTTDPLELVQPLNYQLGFVADETGIPLVNLCYRTAELMRQLVPEEEWDTEAEKRVRSTLRSAGLELPYPRPRAEVARRAVCHVVAELVDAGRLGPDSLARLEPELRFFDPSVYLIKPTKRPSSIPHIAGLDKYAGNKDGWVADVSKADEGLLISTMDGRSILAEETNLKYLEWSSPSETRCAVVCASTEPKRPHDVDASFLFYRLDHNLMHEYPTMLLRSRYQPIIVRNYTLWADSSSSDWLALNPVLGYMLGWHLDSTGLFRWLDANGTVMVESLWWSDGLFDLSPPQYDNEVGNGWLVVAAQDATEIIAEKLGPLQRRLLRVRQNVGREEGPQQSSWYAETAT